MKKYKEFLNESVGQKLVAKALAFATKAHAGQIRKYVGEPYVEHPKRVALTMKKHGFDHHVQAAALLHDTIEDCGVKSHEIHRNFGKRVGHMVDDLSDLPKEAGNRKFRKGQDDMRLHNASHEVQSIKCADTIDNSPSIKQHDPNFYKVYSHEKHNLLGGFTKAHPELLRKAKDSVGMA